MQFTGPNPELRWFEMTPDLAIGEMKEFHKAGIVVLRLSIHDVTKNGPIDRNDYPQWVKKQSKRGGQIIKVRCFCWQARNLPAADESGSSDPFIRITDADKTHNSSVIRDHVNPLFYEGIDVIYETNSIDELPPNNVNLYDKDELIVGAENEDFLSRALIYIQNVDHSDNDTIPKPSSLYVV